MLAVASVAGAEFSAAVAGRGRDRRRRRRSGGARRWRGEASSFARPASPSGRMGRWRGGTPSFTRCISRRCYARVSVGDRVGLHLRTGERLERGYGQRAGEIAGELAMHFEHGRDFERAARYRRQAGEHALRQHAYREAADHATRALTTAPRVARVPGAHPAGAGASGPARGSAVGDPGLRGARGGAYLRARTRAVRAGRRHGAAVLRSCSASGGSMSFGGSFRRRATLRPSS